MKKRRKDNNTYVNKAVMEMKTNERSSHPYFGLQGDHNLLTDDLYKIWARFSVNVKA